ncbi:MAG: pentapeptide repeat-containing protein [Elainella sp. Prado103]|nr:pentapeptide repeat-containing protein [Elainella sp. Prado103]
MNAANLTETSLSRAKLAGAKLTLAVLQGENLKGVDLPQPYLL